MPFEDLGGLRAFRFESFGSPGVKHAVFTRAGGVSPAPWASLNFGAMVGDDAARVRANRGLALAALGLASESVFDVWQVHSAEVVLATAPRGDAPAERADAILTDRAGVTLMMRFADCVPILLHDPVRNAVGIVHAGWLGTVRQVVRGAVRRMRESLGSRPSDRRWSKPCGNRSAPPPKLTLRPVLEGRTSTCGPPRSSSCETKASNASSLLASARHVRRETGTRTAPNSVTPDGSARSSLWHLRRGSDDSSDHRPNPRAAGRGSSSYR